MFLCIYIYVCLLVLVRLRFALRIDRDSFPSFVESRIKHWRPSDLAIPKRPFLTALQRQHCNCKDHAHLPPKGECRRDSTIYSTLQGSSQPARQSHRRRRPVALEPDSRRRVGTCPSSRGTFADRDPVQHVKLSLRCSNTCQYVLCQGDKLPSPKVIEEMEAKCNP